MKNIFVYGGCVSRDVFNPEYNVGELKLVNYIARNSIAKLADEKILLTVDDSRVKSPFQRKLLKNDSENKLLDYVVSSNFDFLLMDVMFTKYRIVAYKDTWLTYSSELKRSGLINSSCKMLSCKDDAYWEKFISGVELFFNTLDGVDKLNSVMINQLYLASADQNGKSFDDLEYIDLQNQFLDRAYVILGKFLKDSQFLKYDEKFFIANTEHRWGIDPMHYINDFYLESYKKIRDYKVL